MKAYHHLWVVSALAATLWPSPTSAQLVAYSNWAPSDWSLAYPTTVALPESGSPTDEFGDEVILEANTPRLVDTFAFQYYAENSQGNGQVTVRFYQNDGPLSAQGFPTPQTVLFESQALPLAKIDGRGSLTLENLNVTVPDSFTWTLQFNGLSAGQSAGSAMYGTQTAGISYDDFWEKSAGQWNLYQFSSPSQPGSFGAQITVVPEPAAAGSVLLTATLLGMVGLRIYRAKGSSSVSH